jgi:hypothetical protein
MTRISIVGLSLVTAVAFGAMAASSAYAGEAGVCIKTVKNADGKYTGQYTDKDCRTHADTEEEEAGKKNEWKWEAATGEAYTSTGEDLSITSKAGAITTTYVTCKATSASGKWTTGTTGQETTTWTGCGLNNGECHTKNVAAPKGTITSSPNLATKLVFSKEKGPGGLSEPGLAEAWTALSEPAGEPILFTFECEKAPPGEEYFQVRGTVSGPIKPLNKMTDDFTQTLGKKGEQGLTLESSRNGFMYGNAVKVTLEEKKATIKITPPGKEQGKIEIRT